MLSEVIMSHKSKPRKIILSFFAKVDGGQSSNEVSSPCNIDACSSSPTSQIAKFEKVDILSTLDTPYLERDLGLRMLIKTCPIDRQEDVWVAYIDMRPFQLKPQKYQSTKHGM